MVPAFSTALSGLNAAERRLSVSAENIANMHSTRSHINGETVNTPYRPQQVHQTSLSGGGVSTTLSPTDPPTRRAYNPDDPAANAEGIVEEPNVNLEKELVNQIIATYDYKANLSAIKASSNMMKMLDVIV